MTYRRDSEAALRWKKWAASRQELIVSSGVESAAVSSEEAWWDYLMHEVNVPGYDYRRKPRLNAQQAALEELVALWTGGAETALGEAFLSLRSEQEAQL